MPAISVIVPARNAAATLPRTLSALAAQETAEPFEVIVVDDGSTDATGALAEGADVVTEVLHTALAGPAEARNAGVAAARSPYLAFTDADCFPRPGWLDAGLAALGGADLVQGRVEPDPAVAMGPFDRSVWVDGETGLYETASLFVTREAFDRVGGFEDWLGAAIGKPLAEDVWFGWKVRRSGGRTAFCEDCLVHHAVFERGAAGYVGERVRLAYFPAILRKVPELRSSCFARVFLTRRSAAFDLALLGAVAAAASRSPVPLATVAPYAWINARHALPRGRRAALVAAVELAADAVSFGALVAGTVRSRTLLA